MKTATRAGFLPRGLAGTLAKDALARARPYGADPKARSEKAWFATAEEAAKATGESLIFDRYTSRWVPEVTNGL